MISIALKALTLGAVGAGAYKMTTNEFKYYGLLFGEPQIKAFITLACKVISPLTEKQASLLLAETIAVESDNGKAKDYSPNYGEGLTQFDKVTFEDVKNYYKAVKYDGLANKIRGYLMQDIRYAKYEDLRISPMLSIVFARLLYLRVSENIPTTKEGRWLYYKKWFNSSLGATTRAKYYIASSEAVYNV